jgi:ABC-2 type transport system permease protein
MIRLIRAEFLKLRTTRALWALLGETVGLTLLSVWASLTSATTTGAPLLSSHAGIRGALGGYGPTAAVPALLLGVLALAGESRHRTITQTFLASPRRGRVVAAKLVSVGTVAAVFAVVATAVDLAVSLPWLASRGVHVPLLSGDLWLVAGGAALTVVLYGLAGVGVGALVDNLTVAVVAAVVFLFVVQSLAGILLPEVARWLPGGAALALGATVTRASGQPLLPVWAGGVLLAGYGALLAASGTVLLARRDIN